MSNTLQFKGTWRTYQKRVLLHADNYLKDGKIHIVAAPGSGKTTLGIELIGRIDKPALILAPSITIREQWIERIKDGFLAQEVGSAELISNNLKQPAFITVATYQALHSAITRYKGSIKEKADECGEAEEDEEIKETDSEDIAVEQEEEVDYSNFELISTMRAIGLGVICLDECHHLRSEWWKALESFRKEFEYAKIISLTATPPYDASPAMWKRYIEMCGEVDEEITIPELVKEGSLCPHQDYVLFNYPTREETAEVESFKQNSAYMLKTLMEDSSLEAVIQSHKGLLGEASDDLLLDNPAYLSSLLIYLQDKQLAYPRRLQKLLGAKTLPHMEEKWMELLLQGLLFDDCDSYVCDKVFRESLCRDLKSRGLLEKKKVCMVASTAVSRMLIRSKGKIESIKGIVNHEYRGMGSQLRLLILTDYIRKEYESNLGDLQTEISQMGVLPFFEMLRREAAQADEGQKKLRLGVLCGTMVIIPSEAKEYLLQITDTDKISFSRAGKLSEEDYLTVKAVGKAHFLTAAVTELFSKGYIQVLIGTKSLLGEGWDAPCVNSLVLASFVGSFMLSNQMRGRAIRVDKNNPDKTSNIWHLVCVTPPKRIGEADDGTTNEDFQMLTRRMEHFMGLHYEEETIESGIVRLSAIQYPFTKSNVKKTNDKMLQLSDQRIQLKKRWKEALSIFSQMEMADEVDISEHMISISLFYDALRAAVIMITFILFDLLLYAVRGAQYLGTAGIVISMGLALGLLYFGIKAWRFRSPLRRLKIFGQGIRKAMLHSGMLASENCKVEAQSESGIFHAVYLIGGTAKEKADFANCAVQFFSEIDNQRYLLVKHSHRKGLDGFFAVPDAFAKKKEDAQLFAECMKRFIGTYDLVYTRNIEGRRLLLEGRVRALGSREQRCFTKKKVKGALE